MTASSTQLKRGACWDWRFRRASMRLSSQPSMACSGCKCKNGCSGRSFALISEMEGGRKRANAMITKTEHLTLDEFMRLYEKEGPFELIDGERIIFGPPKFGASGIA